MRRKAIQDKASIGAAVSQVKTLPAPTKGWYVGTNISLSEEGTAYILQNAFPRFDYVRARRGSANYATGMPAQPVTSLAVWTNGVLSKMLAGCGGAVYDASGSGAVGASLISGLGSSTFEATNFTNSSGNTVLSVVNGIDPIMTFDGTQFTQKYISTGTLGVFTLTATPTNGSPTVASVTLADWTQLSVGEPVTGSGIAAGSKVLSWDQGASTITLDTPATSSPGSVTLTVDGIRITSVASFTSLAVGQAITGTGIPDGTFIASLVPISSYLTLTAPVTASGAVTFTAYSTPPVWGMDAAPASFNWVHKNRLYFIQTDSMNVWYLPLGSIGGVAIKFPIAGIFKHGGKLLCGGTWAINSTSGIYESWVVISTEGEVAMYNGDWPGGTWALQGMYKVSKPLGPRCLYKSGGDLLIATVDGIVPMSKVMELDQLALQNSAITAPIAPAWQDAVQEREGLFGWQIIAWPVESFAIVNLPKASSTDVLQFVCNTRTGAWASYVGWDAQCFALFNEQLFFGNSSGTVLQAEVGGSDNGTAYQVIVFPSFTKLDGGPNGKQIMEVRPTYLANFNFSPTIKVNVNFDINPPLAPGVTDQPLAGAQWGTAIWGADVWPATLKQFSSWKPASGFGFDLSPITTFSMSSTVAPDVRFLSMDILYESGELFT